MSSEITAEHNNGIEAAIKRDEQLLHTIACKVRLGLEEDKQGGMKILA